MAETQGVVGLNTQFKIATESSPSNFQLVGECGDITLSGETSEFAEFTHQQSTGGYREYKPTFKNPGELSTQFNWTTDMQQAALKTALNAQSKLYCQVVYPNGKQHEFQAYVGNLGVAATMNGPLRKTLTMRLTGQITEEDAP